MPCVSAHSRSSAERSSGGSPEVAATSSAARTACSAVSSLGRSHAAASVSWRDVQSTGSFIWGIEFHLLEETKHAVPGPDVLLKGAELLVGGLAEGALDREPREVEVLLDHHGGDPRVDLDHLLAHELDAEEPLELELLDDARRRLDELRRVERDEVHAEPAAHRLARPRRLEDDAAAVGDPVHGALVLGEELHHAQVEAGVRHAVDRLPARHRAPS